MHERNIYNTPPNFVDLAKKYDFFAPFLTLDASGNAKINFKDEAALRALSRALLLQDFNLDVHIPENVLVPTIPLRLNYILWIEDLLVLNHSLEEEKVIGIDIGTGATSIYALLAARKNKWRMVGTEINPESIKSAQENIERNKLSELVKIIPIKSDSVFGDSLTHADDGYYYFTMCNPPFFSNEDETDSVMKGRFSEEDKPLRSPPSAVKTGEKTELVVEGGELKFVQDIINESLKFAHKVRIFTSMIGIKRHLKQLTASLRAHGVINYTTTEFVQGKTMRWGLAWSFYPGVQLFSSHPDIFGTFPNFSTLLNFESLIHSYLTELHLHTLEWLPTAASDDNAPKVIEVIATENTWSHQRRLRREMERRKRCEELMQASSKNGPTASKQMKLSSENGQQNSSMECEAIGSPNGNRNSQVLIHFIMDLVREGSDAQLIMRFRDGTLGKDGMNQIMQFLKNRFAKDCSDTSSSVYHIINSTK